MYYNYIIPTYHDSFDMGSIFSPYLVSIIVCMTCLSHTIYLFKTAYNVSILIWLLLLDTRGTERISRVSEPDGREFPPVQCASVEANQPLGAWVARRGN